MQGVNDEEEEDPKVSDEEEASSSTLDLTRLSNESAGVELAMECMRCARSVGIVISRGDFESTLDIAVRLHQPEVRAFLPACMPACVRCVELQGSMMDTDTCQFTAGAESHVWADR